VKAQNGVQYRFYELTGDLPDTLHFRHFESTRIGRPAQKEEPAPIRVKAEPKVNAPVSRQRAGRVKLHG
jgi:hypothetical protein